MIYNNFLKIMWWALTPAIVTALMISPSVIIAKDFLKTSHCKQFTSSLKALKMNFIILFCLLLINFSIIESRIINCEKFYILKLLLLLIYKYFFKTGFGPTDCNVCPWGSCECNPPYVGWWVTQKTHLYIFE